MRILFLEIPLCICGLCFRRFGDLIPYTVYEKWLLDSSVSVENVIEIVRISETSTTQPKSLSPRNGNHIITTFSITGLISWTFESRMHLLKWSGNYQNIFFSNRNLHREFSSWIHLERIWAWRRKMDKPSSTHWGDEKCVRNSGWEA
jgi:hypothetical protein